MPEDPEYEVNDCLGITQFVTGFLEEDQAVLYLLGIETLSLDDWLHARTLISSNTKITKRQSKDLAIRDLVKYFINEECAAKYLVANLAILPGMQTSSVSYIVATIQAIDTHIKGALSQKSSRLTSVESNTLTALPEKTNSASNVPPVTTTTDITNGSDETSGGWVDPSRRRNKYKRPEVKTPPETETVIHGSLSSSADNSKRPQLSRVCLGVRSGPDETADSLKAEIQKAKIYSEIVVDAVSRTNFYSLFRVRLQVAVARNEKWKDPKSWPSRVSVSLWKGDPQKPLRKLEERVYTKKIYIGNIASNVNDEMITENLKGMYEEEMKDGIITDVETIPNREGATRSVCVILTSAVGKTLMDIPLKIHLFPRHMRKWVRWWKGFVPYPEGHEKNSTLTSLTWS